MSTSSTTTAMVCLCCVPLCSARGGFRFPTDLILRKRWLIAIKRDQFTPKNTNVVCRKHFKPEDFISQTYHGTPRERLRLKKDAVPSLFKWTKDKSQQSVSRAARARSRSLMQDQVPVDILQNSVDLREEEIETSVVNEEHTDITDAFSCVSVMTQTTPTSRAKISVDDLSPKMLHYYTGLTDHSTFSFVLRTLGQGAYHLNYRGHSVRNISVENQFLLTLIKLRCHSPNVELSFLFGICEKTVSNVFITWINFMFCKWQNLQIWPSRDLVRFYIPEDFKRMYPSTRVVLDGVEVPIKKPKNPKAQQVTYSSYKNRNTLKSIPGITPGGLVSYIPAACGGSVSDRMFVERGDLTQRCDPKDSIMVDKGFDIQDIFAPMDITVNIPTFLKKGNQFSVKELTKDRKIASKRVHVERVIGLAKTYKILSQPMNDIETVLGSRIIFVCFMLCNMRPCIVPRDA